ncbi:hypothetical protein [Candidatus Ruminimicrobium bovinum]|uniref:hypothetical protein n=1 Tax=Candidatus Ruminimicrobium bovinum TaxID=3242779 RepID=UPI0039B8759A
MSSKDNTYKIPIIKKGKDIGRFVLSKKTDGKYDIKIDFFKFSYKVQLYKLFSNFPTIYTISKNISTDISYHPGINNKPITIHVKNKNAKSGEQKYITIGKENIVAPSINKDFPIPIFKLEIPDSIVSEAEEYIPNGRHKDVIDIGNNDVLEVFITANHEDNIAWFNKHEILNFMFLMLPFEFFLSGDPGLNDGKNSNFIPKGSEHRGAWLPVEDILIITNFFPTKAVNSAKEITISFIENGLYEDFLFNTKVFYPSKENPKDGVIEPIVKQEMNNKLLSNDEKMELKKHYYESRIKIDNKAKEFK